MIKKTNIVATFTFLAFTLGMTQAWAERVLLTYGNTVIKTSDRINCNRPVNLRVESPSPELFEGNSGEMQTFIDSAQAILLYECPGLSRLNIEGMIAGIDSSVYTAVAEKRGNWEVQTERKITKGEVAAATQTVQKNPQRYEAEFDNQRSISLASLTLDMTVDASRQNIWDVFGAEPTYNLVPGLMNLETGGCPAEYFNGGAEGRPNTEWKCLKAWFTDRRVAKLYRLGYVQVVEGKLNEVRRALIDNFGSPVIDDRNKRQRTRTLGWQSVSTDVNNQEVVERLDATLTRLNNLIMIELVLHDPALAQRYDVDAANTGQNAENGAGGTGTYKSTLKL